MKDTLDTINTGWSSITKCKPKGFSWGTGYYEIFFMVQDELLIKHATHMISFGQRA